jgi:uncharacterized protein
MIEWAEARQPLASWETAADRPLPVAGLVTPVDHLSWIPIDDHRQALVESTTGGWIVCDSDDRIRIDNLWDTVANPATDAVLELLWRRGLARISGSDVLRGVDVGGAIEASRQRYTLVLLLSTGCNLACNYCYLGHRQPTSDVAMPVGTALAAIEEALKQPWDEVMFDFGEVAVSGKRFETIARAALTMAADRGKHARIAIQSNATTIDDRTAALLAELDAVVGISLDGPAEIHDAARRFRSGAGSYDRVVRALGLLAERSVSVHLIATIGRHNVERPIDVVEELVSQDPTSFLLKPVLAKGEAYEAWDVEGVTAEAYARFMTAVLRHAAKHGPRYLDQTATKFMARLLGDRNGWRDSCTSRSCGSGRSLHVVDPNGRSHSCPRFVEEAPSARSSSVTFLPTNHGSGPAVVRPSLADLLPEGLRAPPEDCGGCPWLATCGGGCTLISHDPARPAVPQPDPHCVSYDAIHRELVQQLLPRYLTGELREESLFNGATVRRLQSSPA